MKELSIFVDESGDFGDYSPHSPFYILSLVIHNQNINIETDLKLLEHEMANIGWPIHCIHAGPLIRSEYEYKPYNLKDRQQVFKRLMTFTRKLDFKFKSFYVFKKDLADPDAISSKLCQQLSSFIQSNIIHFTKFDNVKIYYDNGQVEISRILSNVFNTHLQCVEFRKVLPSDYRLFQVADLICTLKLTELKYNNHILSKSEKLFFKDERTFKKNYLKPLKSKEL